MEKLADGFLSDTNVDSSKVLTDDYFLLHLQKLEAAKQGAEVEAARLLNLRNSLSRKLGSLNEQRNIAGAKALTLQSKELRRMLEDRLQAALVEECQLREDISTSLDERRLSCLYVSLGETKGRLLDGAKTFEFEQSCSKAAEQLGVTRFDIDRSRKALDEIKYNLQNERLRLETVQRNQRNLQEKHRIEQEKNNSAKF